MRGDRCQDRTFDAIRALGVSSRGANPTQFKGGHPLPATFWAPKQVDALDLGSGEDGDAVWLGGNG